MEAVYFLILLLAIAAGFWLLFRRLERKTETKTDDQAMLLLQNQLNELNRTLDTKLGESTRAIQTQFGHSAKIIADVTERLTKLDETNRQVVNFTDQLQSLQDILKNPKQRGILGEYYLETLLKNVLPTGSYEMQYAFKDGTIVDAVVFVKDKIIPIDSKFSLENYNRLVEERDPAQRERLEKLFVNDLKNRIVETSKYIQPAQGTMDFAFMFIPHEAIYYDLLVNKVGAALEDGENLIQRAAGKYHVIIVSPTSFLAYLQTVMQGLKAMQIEESVKVIVKNVGDLQKHLKAYEEYHGKLGNALGTVVNHYNTTSKEFKKVDKDVMRITGETMAIEPAALEGPQVED